MKILNLYNKQSEFSRCLILAIGLHISVCLLLYIFAILNGTTFSQSLAKQNKINFLESSVRVDIVSMPKLTIQELKNFVPAPEVMVKEPIEKIVEETIAKDDLIFEKKKTEKKKLLSFLKDMSEKKIPKVRPKQPEVEKSKQVSLKSLSNKDLSHLAYMGNKISAGTSAYGDGISEKENGQFSTYLESLPDIIRPYWRLPTYLKEQQELRCRIRIYLSADGQLLRAVIFEESGEVEYDQLAMKAVRDASPFPPPIKSIVSRVVSGEILLGFPL